MAELIFFISHFQIAYYLPTCILAHLHTCILVYLHTYLYAYLSTCIPAFIKSKTHWIRYYFSESGVPPNSVLFGGTVPPNSLLFGRTVPPNGVLFGGTVPPDSSPHFFTLPLVQVPFLDFRWCDLCSLHVFFFCYFFVQFAFLPFAFCLCTFHS